MVTQAKSSILAINRTVDLFSRKKKLNVANHTPGKEAVSNHIKAGEIYCYIKIPVLV